MTDQTGAAPAPYTTVDIGCGTSFHTYLLDCNGRKIGVAWGPTKEKVWTAALWAAAPDLLNAILKSDDAHWTPAMRAAIAKATGTEP